MRKIVFFILAVVLLTSCKSTMLTKGQAYSGIYEEKPLTVLIMPPINKSTNVEAKEYFHTTLNIPIGNRGYYTIPPFMSMEMLKRESAYDSERFIDGSLLKLGDVFGADLALFTIIHKWDKSSIGAKVKVQVEYVMKSTSTNSTLYRRTGEIVYDASINTGLGGIANFVASAINTAATSYVSVGRVCNAYSLIDVPLGKYDDGYNMDQDELAGKNNFKVRLDSKY